MVETLPLGRRVTVGIGRSPGAQGLPVAGLLTSGDKLCPFSLFLRLFLAVQPIRAEA